MGRKNWAKVEKETLGVDESLGALGGAHELKGGFGESRDGLTERGRATGGRKRDRSWKEWTEIRKLVKQVEWAGRMEGREVNVGTGRRGRKITVIPKREHRSSDKVQSRLGESEIARKVESLKPLGKASSLL